MPAVVRAADAAATATSEHELKATALRNLLVFTEWPETAFSSADAPIVIAVFGREALGEAVANLIKDETWHGRPVMLHLNPPPAEAKSWHVVFVSRTEQDRWPSLRKQFAGRPILTVSDAEDFARDEGMVQFTLEEGKLRLAVNVASARAARLQISSTVLRLATVIGAATD